MLRSALKASIFAFTIVLAPAAQACGAAYPGGPMVCTMDDAPSRQPRPRVALSWSYTTTTILFGSGRRADLRRHTVFAGSEIPLGRSLAIRFGAGGIVEGELVKKTSAARSVSTFGPGASVFAGIAGTLIDERPMVPFLQIGLTLSVSRAVTRGPLDTTFFTALDARGSATAGKTLQVAGLNVVPYAAVRAFGGPVYTRFAGADVTGTDLYKYQVAGGVAVARPDRSFDLFAEAVPAGEGGFAAGLGTAF